MAYINLPVGLPKKKAAKLYEAIMKSKPNTFHVLKLKPEHVQMIDGTKSELAPISGSGVTEDGEMMYGDMPILKSKAMKLRNAKKDNMAAQVKLSHIGLKKIQGSGFFTTLAKIASPLLGLIPAVGPIIATSVAPALKAAGEAVDAKIAKNKKKKKGKGLTAFGGELIACPHCMQPVLVKGKMKLKKNLA